MATLIKNLNQGIDIWIEALEQYNMHELLVKPSAESWSLGQLYMHLINDTNFYVEQVKLCGLNNKNADKEATVFAKMIFQNNCFPDKRLTGNPANDSIPQPANKIDLTSDLISLENEINNLAELVLLSSFKGKTRHPGFEYFNAIEWLQFADMHFRHHLKQKKRIDDYLINRTS